MIKGTLRVCVCPLYSQCSNRWSGVWKYFEGCLRLLDWCSCLPAYIPRWMDLTTCPGEKQSSWALLDIESPLWRGPSPSHKAAGWSWTLRRRDRGVDRAAAGVGGFPGAGCSIPGLQSAKWESQSVGKDGDFLISQWRFSISGARVSLCFSSSY